MQRIADWFSDRYYNVETRFDTWRDHRGQTNLGLIQWLVDLAVTIFVVVLLYKLGMAALDKV